MTPDEQFETFFERKVPRMTPTQKLALAEQVRATARQMIAAGHQSLSPENIKAMRELDVEIDAARARLKG